MKPVKEVFFTDDGIFVVRSVSWQKAFLLGVFTGVSFEMMEVVLSVGIFDVDDALLNAFGVLVGYGSWVLLKRERNLAPGWSR